MSTGVTQIGPYRISEEIGRGGMGVVYRAVQPSLNRVIALKVLPSHKESDARAVQRFRREAETAASLTHHNIVKVWEASVTHPPYYIAMEFLPGGMLSSRLTGVPLPAATALAIIIPLCDALDHAHQRGVNHRDIKPENIMFNGADEAVLMDFGIAKAVDVTQCTEDGTRIGTANYMSPEQAKGLPLDSRSDLYSLAVVLYEMLAGRVPFRNTDPLVTMRQIIEAPVPDPCAFNPALSRNLGNVLLHALAKKPNARYQNGAAFAQALQDALKKSPSTIITESNTFAEKLRLMWQDQQRRRILVLLGVVVMVLAAVTILSLLNLNGGGTGTEVEKPSQPPAVTPASPPGVTPPSSTNKIPDVNGKTVTDAKKLLHDAGFNNIAEHPVDDGKTGKNIVIRTNTKAGEPVSLDSTVTLVISKGPPPATIPDATDKSPLTTPTKVAVPYLKGQPLKEAKQGLARDGFTLKPDVFVYHRSIEKDAVIKTFPAVNTPVPKGTGITLYISKGPVIVPKVVGMALTTATTQLNNAGLRPVVSARRLADAENDTVIGQSLPSGSAASANDTVRLEVSQGPGVVVPSVVNASLATAQAQLHKRSLRTRIQYTSSTRIAKDHVIKCQPPVGTCVANHATVTLIVSKGQTTSETLVCPQCGKHFDSTNRSAYEKHVKLFHCPKCHQTFTSRDDLRIHQTTPGSCGGEE